MFPAVAVVGYSTVISRSPGGLPVWFRKRKNNEQSGAAVAAALVVPLTAPVAERIFVTAEPLEWAPVTEPVAAVPPLAAPEIDPSARSDDMPEPRPAAPFPLSLRGQASGSDARAERLIRQIRSEVEDLRQTLDEMATAQEDMVALDLDAVVADREAAAALPPAILVRGLISAAERLASLSREIAGVNESVKRLERLNHELELEHSFNRGRLETLDEVIAALHGNLQDLRYERDQGRMILNANGNGLRPQIAANTNILESVSDA